VLATSHIRSLNQAFKSSFPCLSQLANSLEEAYKRNAFICSFSKGGMYAVYAILIFMKGLTSLCFQSFHHLKQRAGLQGKRISPHILRHTFAIKYLVKSNDPFSLQELLGHEDLATVQNYMYMNDETIQAQKRKLLPG
jgi:site-specific recombinase XerD